ncbi:MAG: acyltransferase domain-containing protein, partial [Kiritimatiellae bacterium]|nr:acyltransferase domain-containing protein [Kiritimatiellia bacterium]
LQRLAWHCHFLAFHGTEEQTGNIGLWPMLPGQKGKAADMFYAVVFLSGLKHVLDIHQKLGIPEAITLDTLSDLQLWIYEYRKKYGAWGFKEKTWLIHHFRGKLFKLGRLQFLPGIFPYDFHVFRNYADQRVMMLAGENMIFRRDGQFDGANNEFDPEDKWTAKFATNGGYIGGHPVSPRGEALPFRITLPVSEWHEILKKDDPVLTIHIPATGALAHAECGESFRQMAAFWPKYFPEYKFKALTCASWLLDGQFERHLPPTANIVRFLAEFYLHPIPNADEQQTFERVFGQQIDDVARAPQNTSLQRAVIKHIKNGGRWRSGGGILFAEDLQWGEQTYRKNERDYKSLA